MPRRLMECPVLSNASKVCYLALASFAGKDKDTCWPSQEVLAKAYGASERSTREHLAELEQWGVIRSTQKGLRRSNTYEFFSLEDWDYENFCPAENRRSGTAESAEQGTAENRRSGTAENRRSLIPLTEPLSYEPLSKPVTACSAVPSSPQDQNLQPVSTIQEPTPLPDSGGPLPGDDIAEEAISGNDLALEDDIATFCANGYSRKRRIRIKPKDLKGVQDKLESLEREHGQEDLRRAFLEFLGRDDEWLVKNKWPIFSFTKNPIQYMTQSPRSPRQSGGYSASPIAYRSASTSEAPADVPTASPQNTSDPVLQFVDKWNTINPDHPVGELLAATKAKLRAAASDPDFVRVHEELFEKVGKFIAAGQDVGFTWLFTGKEPNWIGTMEGKYQFFLAKKAPVGGGVDMDRLIQEAEE